MQDEIYAEVFHGDCLGMMKELDDCFVDSIVCDPPYGLSFMGKNWDHGVPGVPFWAEALRVAKPGAHLLAFGGTRTFHRLACAIEDAGWEIRDTVMWVYGSGFPKSLDIGKAVDKLQGNERTPLGTIKTNTKMQGNNYAGDKPDLKGGIIEVTKGTSEWEGYGTALKPAWEPILICRKPLAKGCTVAENVLRWGTGGLNVDGCRVEGEKGVPASLSDAGQHGWRTGGDMERKSIQNGRWPANLIHDGSDEVVGLFPDRKTTWVSPKHANNRKGDFLGELQHPGQQGFNDSGSAARFFYCAKASRGERERGLRGHVHCKKCGGLDTREHWDENLKKNVPCLRNNHPTVKPVSLMSYLCRLVTPVGGLILDPFVGSGSTGVGAVFGGFSFLGIDNDPESAEIAKWRVASSMRNRLPLGGGRQ